MQIRIMLVVCLLVLIFLSLYWSVVLVQLLFVFLNTFVFSSVCKPLLKCCGRFNSCWCSE